MADIVIRGMEMPKDGEMLCINISPDGKVCISLDLKCEQVATAVPAPPHVELLKVLKTERECVSRDCDRNCGECDLSLERTEILSAYDALILMLDAPDPAEDGEV